jgi:POT family proton-dependent oligopeptide transporter
MTERTENKSTATGRGFAALNHPRGLYTLFFTEMWERFSYYGMRAILMLFMLAPVTDGGLGMRTEVAGSIYAMYTSLVYLMSIPGGWIADNLLGQRKSVLYGGIVIMIGHILLAMHGMPFFFGGLGCVILGTGLLKPNISAIVGQLYDQKDTRRDAGFSIFYMGINLGAFSAPLVCGFFAQDPKFQEILRSWNIDPRNSWHWGFAAAAVGMFFGLVQYLATGRNMGEAGLRPAPETEPGDQARRWRTFSIGAAIFVAVAAIVAAIGVMKPELLNRENISRAYQVLLVVVVVGFFGRLFLAGKWTSSERNRLFVIVILFAAAAVFWGVFEQAGSTQTIFAEMSTDNSLLGRPFPSSWWQSVNAAFIVLLAPAFSALWLALGRHNPSYGTKFAIGLLFVGLGFLWLVGGAKIFTEKWDDYVATNREAILAAAEKYNVKIDPDAKIEVSRVNEIISNARDAGVENVLPPWKRVGIHWLFGVYLLHTIGELCLSPVGLSAMTKLAPARVVGQMMGVWFLASSIGNYLGGSVASYYEQFELPTLLMLVACSAFVMTIIMLLLVRPIKRWMAE